MQIDTHKRYDKAWAKLTQRQQAKALQSLEAFANDSTLPSLRVHQLKGDVQPYPPYSISAGGDLRIYYVVIADDYVVLIAIGSHAQLYD